MRNTITIILFLNAVVLQAASPKCKKNEETVLSFRTVSNKIVSVCTGCVDSIEYIVYRYGTDSTVELEYPAEREGSFSKFFYSYYHRGGGALNEGLDINKLEFSNGGYVYEIYEDYYAVDNSKRVGIKIKNEKTGKEFEIKGRVKTKKGSLTNLQLDDRVPQGRL